MSRIIGVVFLLLGPVLLNGLTGCDTCNPAPYRFGILDYKAFPRKITDQSYKPYLIDTLSLSDSVTYRQLELILIGQETTVALDNQHTGGSTLWACEPAVIAVDSIKHLAITSDQPYGTGLGAGSNLASILTIGEGSYDQRALTEFLTMPLVRAQSFYSLRFRQAPEKAGRYQFQVKVDWGQGKRASFLTRPIFIKP
jgi:hypothetical protein